MTMQTTIYQLRAIDRSRPTMRESRAPKAAPVTAICEPESRLLANDQQQWLIPAAGITSSVGRRAW